MSGSTRAEHRHRNITFLPETKTRTGSATTPRGGTVLLPINLYGEARAGSTNPGPSTGSSRSNAEKRRTTLFHCQEKKTKSRVIVVREGHIANLPYILPAQRMQIQSICGSAHHKRRVRMRTLAPTAGL